MVNFKQLNEELLDFIEAMQLNEMAIYYGTDHGTVDNVVTGFKKLSKLQEGMLHITETLRVDKIVTQQEIDQGLFDPIQKGIIVSRQYPIVMVWGEQDTYHNKRKLEGHGVSHIIQGHLQDLHNVLPKLEQCINKNVPAKVDKYGNYTIKINNYRFAFMLVNNEDGTPKHAVLVTAFKR